MRGKNTNFSFGKNWTDYVKGALSEEKIGAAKKSLLGYLPQEDYKGKVFIDIGCGSGIFSFGALSLGCKKVISFDVDERSVEATRLVKERFSRSAAIGRWEIFKGSILDDSLVQDLKGQGDIVYSWGVLHHTGDMRQAIRNAALLVKPNGFFIIAIYNKTASSDFWKKFKRFYNLRFDFMKKVLNYAVFVLVLPRRIAGSFLKKIKGLPAEPLFSRERGMSVYYDVVDWLGGYPYEYATFDEMRDFVEGLGFALVRAPRTLPSEKKRFLNRFTFNYTGNNEFVFKKIK